MNSICGYAINLLAISNTNTEEAEQYIQLYVEDYMREDGFNPSDELSDDYLESCNREKEVLRKIFGLSNNFEDESYCLIGPFRWICDLFGKMLPTDVNEMPPIYEFEFKNSKLNGLYKSPFGFPPEDENIGYLTLEEIREERKQLEGSLQETFEEACDMGGMTPQRIEEYKREWNDLIYPARKTYLDWLDHCLRKETDLLIIET